MKKDNYWSEFEKSGNISDYLNYVACTSEQMNEVEEANNQVGEGGESGFTSDCNGNSTGCNASW